MCGGKEGRGKRKVEKTNVPAALPVACCTKRVSHEREARHNPKRTLCACLCNANCRKGQWVSARVRAHSSPQLKRTVQ